MAWLLVQTSFNWVFIACCLLWRLVGCSFTLKRYLNQIIDDHIFMVFSKFTVPFVA